MQMLIDETVGPSFQSPRERGVLYMYSPTEYWSKLGTQKWTYGIDGHRPTQGHDEMQNGT
jgi:hypothetical protein